MAHQTSPKYCVGVDLASQTFVASILRDGAHVATSGTFTQSDHGFHAFLLWLRHHGVTRRSILIGMETTGDYSLALATYLLQERYPTTIIDASRIAQLRRRSTPKTDRIDSQAIADYMYRHPEKMMLWQPKEPVLQRLNNLLTARELLIRRSTSAKNSARPLVRKQADPDILALVKQTIVEDSQKIKQYNALIKETINAHPVLASKAALLMTIPGIGLLLAANLLLILQDAGAVLNHRRLTNYLGICPHEYSSGTSVYRKARSSRLGPPRIRKLLNLGARSVMTHQPAFKAYRKKLLDRGKPKMVIINNIENKLIKLACGVLKHQKPFDPTFISVLARS